MSLTLNNLFSGTVFHHAYTQTPQKPEKLLPEQKNCRDTQTAEERERIYVRIHNNRLSIVVSSSIDFRIYIILSMLQRV